MSFNDFLKDEFTIYRMSDEANEYGDRAEQEIASFKGMIQPVSADMQIVNEKESKFNLYKIFVKADVDLKQNDAVERNAERYIVLSVSDTAGRGHHLTALVRYKNA